MIVSVICPCRNEIGNIESFLSALGQQKTTEFDLEIFIADGESTDGTADVLGAWLVREPRLKIIRNPGGIVSTGLNAALRVARGDVVVRMDVHTTYSEDYVAQCVNTLNHTGATCVGGPWLAKGSSLRQSAVAAAFGSRFGSGGAKSRRADYTGPVDAVYLGAWWRADLIALGGFDEQLVRNQDDELCLRITRSGGTVWQSEAIRSSYIPRDSFGALWRQFYQYGYWKAAVARKHRQISSPRQLAPPLFVLMLLAFGFVALFSQSAKILLVGLFIAYVAAATLAAVRAAQSYRLAEFSLVILSFATMHFAYGLGLLHGFVDYFVLRRKAASRN